MVTAYAVMLRPKLLIFYMYTEHDNVDVFLSCLTQLSSVLNSISLLRGTHCRDFSELLVMPCVNLYLNTQFIGFLSFFSRSL